MNLHAQRPRILVVDDEPGVLFALEDELGDDFDVVTALRAEDALEIAAQDPSIAVVISDQRMPRIQGDELLSQLRSRSHATRILCSGYADSQALVRCVNDGAISAFITKPWDRALLHAKISEGAEQFRAGRELRQTTQLFARLLESRQCFYTKDLELRHLRASLGYLRWLGFDDDAAIGGRAASELLPRWRDATEVERAERLLLNEPELGELRLRVGSPVQERETEWRLCVVRSDPGTPQGILGVVETLPTAAAHP